MAKAKSKKFTIEEALLPVEEQPYEVPANWCWTYVGNLCSFWEVELQVKLWKHIGRVTYHGPA